ncbi:MAG: hypothetical protein H7A05_00460 [Pseudomonadales bacterium]|nr:VCBS domain-containing protein [Pseudomonadales bacterium]MCP5330026.1 hypothetical protein [Pseudomonadales bacterium]MCP5343065.1 hypothetical protein [Pseudomonadales bacterium]
MASGKNPSTPTSIKIATLTGAAKDDAFAVMEGTGSYTLDVLANDPGAARLYSLAQISGISTQQFPIETSVVLASGASIEIINGQLVYTNPNAQSLPAGEVFIDTFSYTVRMANGALSQATASVSITGENDEASIAGDNSGEVMEDGGVTQASGILIVTDVDRGENVFATVEESALQGQYGSFTFNSNTGEWTYTLNNDAAAVQALNTGDVVFDELTVSSLDGTATETIRVNVLGQDEATVQPEGEGSIEHVINHGRNNTNALDLIQNFKDGDTLKMTGQISYVSYYETDLYQDNVMDTVLRFVDTSGQQQTAFEVGLIGFTGFETSMLV